MPEYANYVKNFPHTLIPRLLGSYKITIANTNSSWKLKVMNNVLETSLYIHERYDLKGSIVGRAASSKEKAKYGKEAVMKDLDFKDNGRMINLSRQTKLTMILQIENDVRFLKDLGIMDYSLFVGIHFYNREEVKKSEDSEEETESKESDPSKLTLTHLRRNSGAYEQLKAKIQAQAVEMSQESAPVEEASITNSESSPERLPAESGMISRNTSQSSRVPLANSKFCSIFKVDDGGLRARLASGVAKDEHYFIGIIDILQTYDMSKVLETGVKSIKHQKDKLSSVEPEQYAERFTAYIKTIIQ